MLIGACERRLHEFIESRGNWDYRWLGDPVSCWSQFALRFWPQVAKSAPLRISAKDRPDVRHRIVPTFGGKQVVKRLQVLCSKCNRSK